MASESTLTINVVERSQDSGTETPSISENASVVSRSPRACARVMPASFVPRTGVEVAQGVFLGREIGAGVQAKVFDLVHKDGTSVGRVLKIGHSNVARKLFLNTMASSMMDLQHEWELGMQLKAALEESDGSLPGFTRTCDCMVIMADENRGTADFRGLVMEKLNGWPVSKRLMDPAFHNIHYVREMLFQVFSALDRGQRLLGFNHADLGLNNVFEHFPKVFLDVQKGDQDANVEALAAATAAEACTACGGAPPVPGSLLPGRSTTWSRTQMGFGCTAPPPIIGFSCDSNGHLNPLGPHIEFKLIDYGVGEFNEVLAQAAGGYQPEETLRRIQEGFVEKGIPFGAEGKKQVMEIVLTGDDDHNVRVTRKLQRWRLNPFPSTAPGNANRFVALPSPPPSLVQPQSALKAAAPNRGAVELMYRHFWQRKGDVFHFLLALAVVLDDRVWPKEDERDVQLFASLVHHVTGVKIKAYFTSAEEDKDHSRPSIKVMGKKSKRSTSDEALYGARVRCFAALRRARIMISAHLKPFNSGLLAGEALVAPFFGVKGAPHAELPVCVEAAFPFHPAHQDEEAAVETSVEASIEAAAARNALG